MAVSGSSRQLSTLALAEISLSFAGAAVAGALWWAHRRNIDLPCTSGGGCELVAQSKWAHITIGPLHDVPIALCGMLAYIVLMCLSLAKWSTESLAMRSRAHSASLAIAVIGFCYSWYLQYVAHFLIGAFCPYCFSSATVMTLLFLTLIFDSSVTRSALTVQAMPEEVGTPPHVTSK